LTSRDNATFANPKPRNVNFRKLRKRLAKFNIRWDPSLGSGSHGAFVGLTHHTQTRELYPLPQSQQSEVSAKYLKPLRRAFELTEEYGVSDEDFFG
jgi:hypothetical protein